MSQTIPMRTSDVTGSVRGMHATWRVGRVAGMAVQLHASWLIVFALLIWSLATYYFPLHHSSAFTPGTDWVFAFATALVLFASVVAHELAHALAARHERIPVDRITPFALGCGSTLGRRSARPRTEVVVALLGPLANITLGAALWVVWRTLLSQDMTVGASVFYLAYGNLALGALNLLPAFPLDGGRALRALLRAARRTTAEATLDAVRVARVIAVGLLLLAVLQSATARGPDGMWLVAIAWFVWIGGKGEAARAALDQVLRGRNIAPLVRFEYLTLDAEEPIPRAAERIRASPPQTLYPVLAEDSLLGFVTANMVGRSPLEGWPTARLHWLVRRAPPLPHLTLDTDALDALNVLNTLHVDGLPVNEPEVGFIGLLERSAIQQWVDAVHQTAAPASQSR